MQNDLIIMKLWVFLPKSDLIFEYPIGFINMDKYMESLGWYIWQKMVQLDYFSYNAKRILSERTGLRSCDRK